MACAILICKSTEADLVRLLYLFTLSRALLSAISPV